MRRVAHLLGVEAMSLYHHVPRKDDILEGMLDLVFGEMSLPPRRGSWSTAIRAAALSAHHTLLLHPWACGLLMVPGAPGTARLHWMEAILGRLRAGGFSAELAHHAYHALDSHIVGFTLWVLPYLQVAKERPDFAQTALEAIDPVEFPYLIEHVAQHAADVPGDTSEFDFALDLLLEGLERLRR